MPSNDISKKNAKFIERMKKSLLTENKFTDTFTDITKKKVEPIFIKKNLEALGKEDTKFRSLLKTLYLGEDFKDIDDETFRKIIISNKFFTIVPPSFDNPIPKDLDSDLPIDMKATRDIHERIFNERFILDSLTELAQKESNTIRNAVEKITTYIKKNESLYKFILEYFSKSILFTDFIKQYFKNKIPEDDPKIELNAFKVLSDEENGRIKELQDIIIPMSTIIDEYEEELLSLNKDKLVETVLENMIQIENKDDYSYIFESFKQWESNKPNVVSLPYKDKLKLFLSSRQEDFLIKIALYIDFKDYFDAKKEINEIRISNFDYSKTPKTFDKKLGLTKNELDLQTFLIYTVRKEDLSTWEQKDLKMYADTINIPTTDNLITNILSYEFPDIQPTKKFSLSKQEYRRVMDTLSEDQINVLAVKNNIKNFETKNRLDKTNLIIAILFDKLKNTLVLSKNEISLQNFLIYTARKEFLTNLDEDELKDYSDDKNITFTNVKDVIEKILKMEFPSLRNITNIDKFFLTMDQYRRVFDTLTDDQINLLASKNKIKNYETVSRPNKIKLIINKIYENLNPEQNVKGKVMPDVEEEPIPKKERIRLINLPVNEKAVQFITKELSKTLMKIAPTKKDYGYFNENRIADVGLIKIHEYNTPYMQILIKTLVDKSKTIRELFVHAVEIIVNLNVPESKTFKHRIMKEYYLPDALGSLSPSEMFTELYENPKNPSENLNKVSAEIQEKIQTMLNRFEKAYEYYTEPSLRKNPIHFPMNYSVSYKYQNRKMDCFNLKDVENVNSENIVYYEEDGDLYCFDEEKFYSTVTGEEKTNPITNKALDEEFVEKFLNHFNPELSSEGLESSRYNDYRKDYEIVEKKEYKKSFFDLFTKELAPDLLSIVNDHLASLEDDAFGHKEYSDNSSVESYPIDSEKESDKEIEKEYISPKVVKELTDNPDEVCGNCLKYKGQDTIKTIIRNKKTKQNKLIKFCDFNCYKDWEVKKSMKTFKPEDVHPAVVQPLEPEIQPDEVHPALIEPVKKKPKKVVKQLEPVEVEPVVEQPVQVQPVEKVEPTISNIVSDITKSTVVDDSTKNEIAKLIEDKIKDEMKKIKECPPGKILNPLTGRCIKDPSLKKEPIKKISKKPVSKKVSRKPVSKKKEPKKVSRKPVSKKKETKKKESKKVSRKSTKKSK